MPLLPTPTQDCHQDTTIQDGRGFGLAQAIWALECGGFNVMLLTEKNIHTEAYSHKFLGYNITYLSARPSKAKGDQDGVGLMMRERPKEWGVGSMRFHGQNMVIYEIVTSPTRTPLVGVYLPHLALEHLPEVKESLHIFRGRFPVVLGYHNLELDQAQILRSHNMA